MGQKTFLRWETWKNALKDDTSHATDICRQRTLFVKSVSVGSSTQSKFLRVLHKQDAQQPCLPYPLNLPLSVWKIFFMSTVQRDCTIMGALFAGAVWSNSRASPAHKSPIYSLLVPEQNDKGHWGPYCWFDKWQLIIWSSIRWKTSWDSTCNIRFQPSKVLLLARKNDRANKEMQINRKENIQLGTAASS